MSTFLFFQHRDREKPGVREFEDSLLEILRRCEGTSLLILPHIYDLGPDRVPISAMKNLDNSGSLFVFSWISSRAAFWLLRKWGIGNEHLETFDLLQMQENASAEDPIQKVREMFPTAPHGNLPSVEQPDFPAILRRWYPIIDHGACIGCLECVNYCMFGVYEIGEGDRPVVAQPDCCRDGCPACSRVCPGGAILFPEYEDPIISGRIPNPDAKKEPTNDLDELIEQVEEGF